MTHEQLNAFRLQFITHHTDKYNYCQSAEIALQGGCKWIQLRMKDTRLEDVKKVALQVKSLCKVYQAVFLLNDYVELCREVEADGVHLGKEDMCPKKAREILGKRAIIGSTCNRYEDILDRSLYPVDYVGLGPFRFTSTKANLSPVLGIEQYRTVLEKCRQNGISLPVVAIGGITGEDIPALLQTGVQGIALSGAILQAKKPVEETEKTVNKLHIYQTNQTS
jgi:thiamine-phosphate pyrophosphorylase